MYKPVDPKVSFPKMEEGILEFWKEKKIFEKSVEIRPQSDEYVFYDGPPFATGLPHFGHLVPGAIKDIFPRYATMQGKRVERRFGWDCHGLPVEYEMEQSLGISGNTAIENYGVAKFNEACESIVLRYTNDWRRIITRFGRWVDFDNDYKTMNPDYMESIWWVVKSLWDKKLIFKSHYILPTCPRCSTPISNHELTLGGYREVHDPAITIRFKLSGEEDTYFLAWTTTPWTLISNLGLALGADIDYVKVKSRADSTALILAESRLGEYFKNPDDYSFEWRKKGADLEGLQYEPLFPYFSDLIPQGAFRTVNGTHVSTEDGTGIVHTAPGFGEDDYEVMKNKGLPVVCPVDNEGCYTNEVPDFAGRFVKDCDRDIINRLNDEGKLFKREQILHSYPHCWRCDNPLIYKAVGSWFVDIQKIKSVMINANNQIDWVPAHLKEGRFGKWLENARDWAISRNRYWGNPIPIWECDTCESHECLGSRTELYSKIGLDAADTHMSAGSNLHKHHVDKFTWPCSCGGTMRRIPEVLDCWFESGAMPYAHVHYPFENKERFEQHFPADFISEGLDQTRGWFYTLVVLGAALFEAPAFQHVVVNGLVLAADGKKMSKRLRNYTDPYEIMNASGADALRLFLMNSAVVKGENLRFSDEGVRDVLKGTLIPLWNAYSFFVTYANIDEQHPENMTDEPANPLDRWILSETGALVESVTDMLDAYDIPKAIEPILAFIDGLNNWYIRRSRRRFWKSIQSSDGLGMNDKKEAYATLRTALMTLIQVACPFIPFVTDEIYRNLRNPEDPESVHLTHWPKAENFPRSLDLEKKMRTVRQTVSLGRALRNTHDLKIRQPLKSLFIVTRTPSVKAILYEMIELLKEELNVKDVQFYENEETFVEYSAKANFKALGSKLGKDMKSAANRIASLNSSEIRSLVDGATLAVDFTGQNNFTLDLTLELVEVRRSEKTGFKIINEGDLTIVLDANLTPELKAEGMARDMIRSLQNLRKECGFAVIDRINAVIDASEEVTQACRSFKDYIAGETLCDSLEFHTGLDKAVKISVGSQKAYVILEQAK